MTRWMTRMAVAVAAALAMTAPPVDPSTGSVGAAGWGVLEAESFRIGVPPSWQEQDLSHRTILSPTPTDVRAHFREPDPRGDGAAVMFQYTAEPAPEDPVAVDRLARILEDGRASMAQARPDELQYFVQDKGHGCLDGFQVVRGPEATPTSGEPGYHLAFDYEYGCFNGGFPIRGWAWVAFSPDGRKHNIFLTAHEDVWIRDFGTLQAVTASISLPE